MHPFRSADANDNARMRSCTEIALAMSSVLNSLAIPSPDHLTGSRSHCGNIGIGRASILSESRPHLRQIRQTVLSVEIVKNISPIDQGLKNSVRSRPRYSCFTRNFVHSKRNVAPGNEFQNIQRVQENRNNIEAALRDFLHVPRPPVNNQREIPNRTHASG
jgi:hypothetical protein